jgi:putative membrane protein
MKNKTAEIIRILRTTIVFRPLALVLILAAGVTAIKAQDAPTPTARPDSATPMEAKTLSHDDKHFIMKAARASTNEVALSQLADSRASNPEIKPFAQMMITDHNQANSDLKALALSKGIDISRPVDEGKMDNISSLSPKSGADFDKAFAKLMVSAHKGAVDLFKKEVAEGKDPDVVAFAKKYVETLSMHLEHATALENTIEQ